MLVLFLIPIAWVFAGPEPAKVPVKHETVGKAKAKPVAKIIKKQAKAGKKKKQPQGIVVGKNLKVGMNLDQAITLLGVPKKIKVKSEKKPDEVTEKSLSDYTININLRSIQAFLNWLEKEKYILTTIFYLLNKLNLSKK